MPRVVVALALIVLGAASAGSARAQGEMRMHTSGDSAEGSHLTASGGARVIPLFTWADRTAGSRGISEANLTQPMLMGRVAYGALSAMSTLDLEGLTLKRGELTTGAWGEGYVDRRHPHTYLHEAMVGVSRRAGTTSISLFAGRGFAPFGSDDPMVRPFVKYPVNHHLAQILERVVAVGAIDVGLLGAEVGTFNGDEPVGPAEPPRWQRFGDSWSGRLTLRPVGGIELSYSHASVKSPESQLGGTFDHRKDHASARVVSSSGVWRYALLEWARTDETLRGARVFRYDSFLGEGQAYWRGTTAAVRIERTSRPEEERLGDPFRSVRPLTDLSILGVSRWTTITATVGAPPLAVHVLRALPFVEASLASVTPGTPPGLVNLTSLYGSRRLWMLSVGARVGVGHVHQRMGRYGVAAIEPDPAMPSSAHPHLSADTSTCSR